MILRKRNGRGQQKFRAVNREEIRAEGARLDLDRAPSPRIRRARRISAERDVGNRYN